MPSHGNFTAFVEIEDAREEYRKAEEYRVTVEEKEEQEDDDGGKGHRVVCYIASIPGRAFRVFWTDDRERLVPEQTLGQLLIDGVEVDRVTMWPRYDGTLSGSAGQPFGLNEQAPYIFAQVSRLVMECESPSPAHCHADGFCDP